MWMGTKREHFVSKHQKWPQLLPLFCANYLSSIPINNMQGDCLVKILRTASIKPAAGLSLSILSLSLLPAHTFPPGDELERCTAAAHSDTITTTDLIPSCPSTHTFNLLGRLEESLVRCLSDLVFLALGLVVSPKVSVCVCKFSPCQDVFFSMLMHWILHHSFGLFTSTQSGVRKKTTEAKRHSPGKIFSQQQHEQQMRGPSKVCLQY
ncbi:hypothetical protein ILYODFUR_010421 [Ilyodon furcidens]|uniref:Uncharacterized protein n=1 Tax=Ilyodon furcidens TaxID=33524 RepID=A0ABV0U5I4_9TELE